jgi:hypothetical protein
MASRSRVVLDDITDVDSALYHARLCQALGDDLL